MKLVKRINPKKEGLEPFKGEWSNLANNYQFYQEYDNGWIISVVCKEGMICGDQGLFEVGIWNKLTGMDTIVVVGQCLDFFEVTDLLVDFKKDPVKMYEDAEGETFDNLEDAVKAGEEN